jgi:hypothetical protein
MTPSETHKQIVLVTTKLIELGLCNEQNYPSIQKTAAGNTEISIAGSPKLAISMKDIDYREIYESLEESKSYNVRMIDGGLLQMLYMFTGKATLDSHRLAYFPAPDFEAFQNDPEIYLEDQIYADMLGRSIVSFPIRFDFELDDTKHIDVSHPKSHLTLGQYQNCRIPVSAPLTPILFATFILRNFYNTAYYLHEAALNIALTHFGETISNGEQAIPHLRLTKLQAA